MRAAEHVWRADLPRFPMNAGILAEGPGPETVHVAEIAIGSRVHAIHGEGGQAWGLAACILAELRDRIGVVAVEVLRAPDGPWTALDWSVHRRVELGPVRRVRGMATLDVHVSRDDDAERREVAEASPLLALVAAGEVLHGLHSEWMWEP